MKKKELAVYIPNVIEARSKEVESLRARPRLYEVYSTFYGFSIITAGGLSSEETGVPENITAILVKVIGGMGGPKELKPKRLMFSKNAFSNCTPHQQKLLWKLMNLCTDSSPRRHGAARSFSKLADSRALELLHLALEQGEIFMDQQFLKRCLGEIGHPSSFEKVKDKAVLRYWDNLKDLTAIAGIRHPEALKLVEDWFEKAQKTHTPAKTRYWLILAMSKTRSRKWIPFYRKQKDECRRGDLTINYHNPRSASRTAYENVHPPFLPEMVEKLGISTT